MSGKDESTDEDIPKLSLAEGYIPQPRSPISKSPLLNRDILRFVNDAAAGDALELDPMIFALSSSEDSDWGSGGARRVSPKSMGRTSFEPVGNDDCETTERLNNQGTCPVMRENASDEKHGCRHRSDEDTDGGGLVREVNEVI